MKFWSSDEKIAPKGSVVSCARCAVWFLCIASACSLEAIQAPTITTAAPHPRPASIPAGAVHTGASAGGKTAAAIAPPSTPHAARAATLSLKDGKLTVDANNSDLSQILRDIAAASGMTIDGLGKTDRVFGTYGPGTPRDVLTALLTDSGYNFMMSGQTADGAPRELLLITQTSSAPPSPAPSQTPSTASNPGNDAPEELGPGAIAHIPPDSGQTDEERVQNHLQQLEKMHSALDAQSDPK